MAPKVAMEMITEQAKHRDEIKNEIKKLSESRSGYIRERVDALGGATDSLDEKIFGAVKDQARAKGLIYDSESASY